MNKPVCIATNFDHGTRTWTAWVYQYGTLVTQARGLDEGAAVADAAAAFRSSRYARKA